MRRRPALHARGGVLSLIAATKTRSVLNEGKDMKSIGQLLATLVLSTVPATAQIVEYYHTDALGSVRAVTDSSGAVVEAGGTIYLPLRRRAVRKHCLLLRHPRTAQEVHRKGERRRNRARLLRGAMLRIQNRKIHHSRSNDEHQSQPIRTAALEPVRLCHQQSASLH